jgi:very-short-patch-repair endonuclease
VIFDEASQVRPEDALGALLRGSQLVVVGDTKQLPPTTFFDHMMDGSEEDETEGTASVADMESILGQCQRTFPCKSLHWHYRSKHESLIAVSNREFYGNRLLVYPSPQARDEWLGLRFVHLPQGVYDRGHSRVNLIEAREVARQTIEHYRRFPRKSLGIGTFNVQQQEAIRDEIEQLLTINMDLDELVRGGAEPLFVKNLETIQGDERDVIFLSIGYGFDATRQIKLNFGPLNGQGGERRLNVLISRARERCVVFANFHATDLPLQESTRPGSGIEALRCFLSYAETHELPERSQSALDTESPFEEAVCDCLVGHGCLVRKQVGCAQFRIDLAIIDPYSPGRYFLGVECDGAMYHSSRVARDRDRLRQQILEGMGWKLYRVWSTDWYRNRVESERRLIDAVEKAKTAVTISSVKSLAPAEGDHLPKEPQRSAGPVPVERACTANASATSLTVPTPVSLSDMVTEYRTCTSLPVDTHGELLEQHPQYLAMAVVAVVQVETPVHLDEVVRRIRGLWGLQRSGNRIHAAIERAASIAESRGRIRRRGQFLWAMPAQSAIPRRRSGDPPAKIELVCDEEIAEAVKLVLKAQFATLLDDLITETSRILGIQATHQATHSRIDSVVSGLVKRGALIKRVEETRAILELANG